MTHEFGVSRGPLILPLSDKEIESRSRPPCGGVD